MHLQKSPRTRNQLVGGATRGRGDPAATGQALPALTSQSNRPGGGPPTELQAGPYTEQLPHQNGPNDGVGGVTCGRGDLAATGQALPALKSQSNRPEGGSPTGFPSSTGISQPHRSPTEPDQGQNQNQ